MSAGSINLSNIPASTLTWVWILHFCFLCPLTSRFLFSFTMAEPPSKRRKGGQRQRISALEESEQAAKPKATSCLADCLLEKWSWGQYSLQEVQQIASMACKDMETAAAVPPSDLKFLASLGSHGAHEENMHRGLLQWANDKCKGQMTPSFSAAFNFKPPYNRQAQSLLLPHELFHCIYAHYPQAWKQIILPSVEALKEFWKLQRKHPAFSTVKDIGDFESKLIPLASHGDGTPVVGIGKIWSRRLTLFSWNSLLGLGPTKDQQLHTWSYFDETLNEQTLGQFWQLLGWSFAWLQKGCWPDSDHTGQKHIGCKCFVACQIL